VEKFQAIFDHVEKQRSPSELSIPKLADVFPAFLTELEALLVCEGRSDLCEQLVRLAVVDRCRCREDSCSHFYTAPKPIGSYGPGHENLVLPAERGLVVLEVVDRAIVGIEVLDRPDVKAPLDRYLPLAGRTDAETDWEEGPREVLSVFATFSGYLSYFAIAAFLVALVAAGLRHWALAFKIARVVGCACIALFAMMAAGFLAVMSLPELYLSMMAPASFDGARVLAAHASLFVNCAASFGLIALPSLMLWALARWRLGVARARNWSKRRRFS
jgi:hypothetical protein